MMSSRPLNLRIKIISFRIRVTRLAWYASNTESSKNCTTYISVASCRASRALACILVMSSLGNMSSIISLTKRAKTSLGMRKPVVLLKLLISCSTWLFLFFLATITVVLSSLSFLVLAEDDLGTGFRRTIVVSRNNVTNDSPRLVRAPGSLRKLKNCHVSLT